MGERRGGVAVGAEGITRTLVRQVARLISLKLSVPPHWAFHSKCVFESVSVRACSGRVKCRTTDGDIGFL